MFLKYIFHLKVGLIFGGIRIFLPHRTINGVEFYESGSFFLVKLLIKNTFFLLESLFSVGIVYFCSPFWGRFARLELVTVEIFC